MEDAASHRALDFDLKSERIMEIYLEYLTTMSLINRRWRLNMLPSNVIQRGSLSLHPGVQ